MSWLGLSGKTVVITGAGGGIGQALARSFAGEGARVVLLDRDEERTAPLVTELGNDALTLACDISKAGEIAAAAEKIEVLGGADILVNNAGILRPSPLETVSEVDWSAMLAVNLNGYLAVSQAFGKSMIARGRGVLVHVASIAGTQPQPACGAYSASKAAVLMMSRQLAYEVGPKGLRANTVSTGLVRPPPSEPF